MGLLSTYTSANRVVTDDKIVTYSQNLIYGDWTYQSTVAELITLHSVYEYHRYCSKSYSYVGMDLSTARDCANAMITKYTRSYKISDWQSSGASAGEFVDVNGGSVVMADIAIQKREGQMYDVVINVREDDTRLRSYSTSPASLFTAENTRDYDEN